MAAAMSPSLRAVPADSCISRVFSKINKQVGHWLLSNYCLCGGTQTMWDFVCAFKTRDLFKKIRDTKGTFHTKMGTIKDRGSMDLAEAEDIKKRWQEHTEELYKKYLNDPDSHDGVITHLEPNILEYKVKWASGSITMNKASGVDGIPVELFQILKDDAVKVLHSIHQQIWKTHPWSQNWQSQFSFQSQRKALPKSAQTTAQLYSSHTLTK